MSFSDYLRGKCKLRSGNRDFVFIYDADETLPTAYITPDTMLLFDMRGQQLGHCNDRGFFFRLGNNSIPVAFYNKDYDSICSAGDGGFVGVVMSNSLPFFNLARPSFPFDPSYYVVTDTSISNGTCSEYCSGSLSSKTFIQLF